MCNEGLLVATWLQELKQLIETRNCHPILVRLAWHDSGTYDQRIKDWPARGGANGAIRFDPEMNMGANAGQLSRDQSISLPLLCPPQPLYAMQDLTRRGATWRRSTASIQPSPGQISSSWLPPRPSRWQAARALAHDLPRTCADSVDHMLMSLTMSHEHYCS